VLFLFCPDATQTTLSIPPSDLSPNRYELLKPSKVTEEEEDFVVSEVGVWLSPAKIDDGTGKIAGLYLIANVRYLSLVRLGVRR
jgi:hypothetical protein